MIGQESPRPVWEQEEAAGSTIDLSAAVTHLLSRWPLFSAGAIGGLVIGFLVSFAFRPQFTSRAVFLPPSQRITSMDNPLAMLWKAPSTAIYPGLLASDSVLNDVIGRGDLQRVFQAKDIEKARTMLRANTHVSSDTAGFVTLEVSNHDAQLAQRIANDYLAALSKLNDRLAESSASQQRLLYQNELQAEKNKLEEAEVELKRLQESSGVISAQSQTQAGLVTIDQLRGEIRLQQVNLAALLQGQTENSADVMRARSQLATLESQLRTLERGNASSAEGAGLAIAKAPSINLEFVRLEREVKYHQMLLDAMSKQYENARLEERSEAPGVQIVDFPEVPLSKSWPSRRLFAAAGAIIGLMLSLAAIFFRSRLKQVKAAGNHQPVLTGLRTAVRHPSFRP